MKFAKTILYVEDVPATLAIFEKAFGIPTRIVKEQVYGEKGPISNRPALYLVPVVPTMGSMSPPLA